ncbi:hypothetical protein GCM10018782_60020 [Streptomyces griseoaurantiacus]|nr:hypothetical protein GCM10018782_60020 [Streptomyces griseoaurantiacus]
MYPYADVPYGPGAWNTPPRARHRGLMNAITPQLCATVRTFSLLLSSTRRGARLARLLAVEQLRAWEVSPGVTERAEQIVAELAGNAALHGRVQGRDFRLVLTLDTAPSASPSPTPVAIDSRSCRARQTEALSPTPSRVEASSWSPPWPTVGARTRIRPAARRSGPNAPVSPTARTRTAGVPDRDGRARFTRYAARG